MTAQEYKMNTAFDMYKWYVKKICESDKTLRTVYDDVLKAKGIDIVYREVKGKREIYITYTIFKSILERNNTLAREAVIEGEVYKLSNSLGYLRARRIERNFAKPTVDVIATVNYWKENPEAKERKIKIYHQDDDFVRIAWHKNAYKGVRNITAFDFKPCKDFRVSFARENKSRPLLKFNYLFHPLSQK